MALSKSPALIEVLAATILSLRPLTVVFSFSCFFQRFLSLLGLLRSQTLALQGPFLFLFQIEIERVLVPRTT